MSEIRKEEHAGIVGSVSHFEWRDNISRATAREKEIEVGTIKLLLVTSEKNLAYPVIVRYFWSTGSKSWVLFDYYELYSGKRVPLIF